MLFDRTPTGLKPTDAGREMLWAIDSINTVLETCADRLETLKGGSGGRVAMGVVSTAKYFAPEVIAGFVGLHPAVEINLTVGNRGDMVEALRNYEIDFAIMGRPPRDFAIEAEIFGPHPIVLIAEPGPSLRRPHRADAGGPRPRNPSSCARRAPAPARCSRSSWPAS